MKRACYNICVGFVIKGLERIGGRLIMAATALRERIKMKGDKNQTGKQRVSQKVITGCQRIEERSQPLFYTIDFDAMDRMDVAIRSKYKVAK